MTKFAKITDWDMKSLVLVIIILQLLYLSKFILGLIDVNLSILYGIIGFISITFIPGTLILKILKIHDISSIEYVLYMTGLSLTFLMLMGLCINMIYPLIGIKEPLSLLSIYITYLFSIFLLILIANRRDNEYNSHENLNDNKITFNPLTLSLLIIPFISIFGTILMNYYSMNSLQIATLVILFIILVVHKKIQTGLYPYALFIVSLSMLLHKSLISNYVHGWDIQLAYRFSEIARLNNYWNFSLGNPYNNLLAFPVLSTIYSKICGIGIHWVYKIFYSFFFALAPVGLYHYYKSRFDTFTDEDVFFSVIIFIFYYGFNFDIADKQKIAELFFIFIIMLLTNEKITEIQKRVLLILFSFALIQSHYAMSYIILIGFMFSYSVLSVLGQTSIKENILIRPNYIVLFLVLSVSWYSDISSGINFQNLILALNFIYSSILDVLGADFESRTGLSVLTEQNALPYTVNKIIFIVLSALIMIGIIQYYYSMLMSKRNSKLNYKEDVFLPLYFFLLLIFSFFSSGFLGVDRIYQISLLMLSPFSIIGNKMIHGQFQHMTTFLRTAKPTELPKPSTILVIFLSLYFICNSGLIYYLSGMHISSNFAIDPNSHYAAYDEKDMYSGLWLKSHFYVNDRNNMIYTDHFAKPMLYEFYDVKIIKDIDDIDKIYTNSYYLKRTGFENYNNTFKSNEYGKIYTNEKVSIYKI